MDPEDRQIIKKTLELSQENNKMLHSIRRSMAWGRIMRTAYWVIIISAAVGVYYYIEPYIDEAMSAYGNIKGDLRNLGDLFK